MILAGDTSLLLTAFLTGLLGSTHCVGMCGGISAALSFSLPQESRQGLRLFGYQLAYNSGRLLCYTLLGAVAGLLAASALAGWAHSPWPRLASGLFMIVLGLYLAGWWHGLQKIEGLGKGLWKCLGPLRQHLLPVDHPLKAIAAGSLWGLLPCGLVYTALTLAITRADATSSAMLMLSFGLGTLPTLLLTGTLAGRIRAWLQQQGIRRAAGIMVVLFGIWTASAAFMHASHEPAIDSENHHHHH
ncbi:MAG: sulfite exporter TauE/SafE family protein [Moraxellaceae bacterium]